TEGSRPLGGVGVTAPDGGPRKGRSREYVASLYRDASRAALLGLGVNGGLGAAKLIGGLAGDSFALLADAVNSFGGRFTSAVVPFALRLTQRPADAPHPYGYARAEAVAASNVALLVVLSALGVGWEAAQRLWAVHDIPPPWTLWLAGANVLIKEGLYQYKARVARRTGSSAIAANAWDHRGDALCSLAVLVGLAAVRWGGPPLLAADEVASLVVVAVITWTAGGLFFKGARELLDAQADEGLVREVRQAAAGVPGVLGVEKLWVRRAGLEYLADLHLEVDPQ